MHVAVAIPTHNRLNHLKRCVDSILSQQHPTEIKLSLVISNNGSEDGTTDYLDALAKTDPRVVIFNEKLEDPYQNFICLANIMPQDVDWVWLMGDDDMLDSKYSISIVCDTIKQHRSPNLHFVHACQSRRVQTSTEQVSGTVRELCETFGLLDMLGWFSSVIVTRQEMVECFLEIGTRPFKPDNTSCFSHAFVFFSKLHACEGIFLDVPLVEPQDEEMTPETVRRWQDENVPAKMFGTIEELKMLKEKRLIDQTTPYQFFRYHQGFLWEKLIGDLIGQFSAMLSQSHDNLPKDLALQHLSRWRLMEELARQTPEHSIRELQIQAASTGFNICRRVLLDESSQRKDRSELSHDVQDFWAKIKAANRLPFEFKIFSRTGLQLG